MVDRDQPTLLVTEARLLRMPDGSVWGNAAFGPRAWQRYLDVFPRVLFVARVSGADEAEPGLVRVDVPGLIEIIELPDYRGLSGLLGASPVVGRTLGRAAATAAAVIVRVPTTSGILLAPRLWATRMPYAVEVVGDPDEVFAPGVVEHPIRRVVRRTVVLQTRLLCARAATVIYVTRGILQRKYPPAPGAASVASSDVILEEAAFLEPVRMSGKVPVLVSVGSMDQTYKGFDVLLDAVARLTGGGTPVHLTIVGDGRHRGALEAHVTALGLRQCVTFLGQLDTAGVRDELRKADLFVLASRTEGLPRAMLEAMAAGLPCVGTTVGGIPELLDPEAMVPPGDAAALADVIKAFLEDPDRSYSAAVRNQEVAHDWARSASSPARREAYEAVRAATAEWRRRRGRTAARGSLGAE